MATVQNTGPEAAMTDVAVTTAAATAAEEKSRDMSTGERCHLSDERVMVSSREPRTTRSNFRSQAPTTAREIDEDETDESASRMDRTDAGSAASVSPPTTVPVPGLMSRT